MSSPASQTSVRAALGFLLALTLALQLTWLLESSGLTSGQLARHAVRVAIKWLLFATFVRRQSCARSWRDLGLTPAGRRAVLHPLIVGLLLTLPVALVVAASPALTRLAERYALTPGPAGPTALFWLGVMAVAGTAAFVEELFYRGYALATLPARFGTLGSVLLAAALFALTHTYAGWLALLGTFLGGIIFSLLFLWRRCLLLPITLHFLVDAGAPALLLFAAQR